MMFWCILVTAVVCLASIAQPGNGYRILCVFPTPSISHQVVYRGLTLALNKRGHELIIVTSDPINDPTLENYAEIDMSSEYETYKNMTYAERRGTMKWIDLIKKIDSVDIIDHILDLPDFRKLYVPESNEKFDLLIVEYLIWPSIYLLAKRFDVPMIGITSLPLTLNSLYNIGSPIMSSHNSNWELEIDISEQLSFWQRVKNFVTVWKHLYWYKNTYVPEHAAIAKKYFGDDIPDLNDLEKNVSLIFINQQGPISYVRPQVPKVIEIGGFHASRQIMNLPKDLQKILDEATEGFVYISLGTNIESKPLPNKTMNKFITAFSRLPYKVLWKFENDVLPGKPENVHTMKWVPQQAVLAHSNLKVFMYQGGAQSTEEAVHHAVPLVGLPLLCDQDMNVNKMVSLGVAKKLEIATLDSNDLFEAISTVANDTGYKQRMLNLRYVINDKPHDPLENAVWWTEHVIRHRGAPHLHSTTADEPWYRRQDMDIVAFISAGFVVVFGLTLIILYQVVKNIHRTFSARLPHTKKTN